MTGIQFTAPVSTVKKNTYTIIAWDKTTVPATRYEEADLEDYNSAVTYGKYLSKLYGSSVDVDLYNKDGDNIGIFVDSHYIATPGIRLIKDPQPKIDRPDWDDYFMAMTFTVSRRSIDPNTKCGCIFVKNNRILATGYNSPPPGFKDELTPLGKPEKYVFFEHAERAAICNAAREGVSIVGAKCYVTGMPCSDCYRAMWNAGITEVIHAPISLEWMTDNHIAKHPGAKTESAPKLREFSLENSISLLENTLEYIRRKQSG